MLQKMQAAILIFKNNSHNEVSFFTKVNNRQIDFLYTRSLEWKRLYS